VVNLSPEEELEALIEGGKDAIARAIAGVQREADRAEQVRAAEFRALVAEVRELIATIQPSPGPVPSTSRSLSILRRVRS
jgi:hypothetical protein